MSVYGYDEDEDEIDVEEASFAWLYGDKREAFCRAIFDRDKGRAISLLDNFPKECTPRSIEKYVDSLIGMVHQITKRTVEDLDDVRNTICDEIRFGHVDYPALLLLVDGYSLPQARTIVETLSDKLTGRMTDLVEIAKADAKVGETYVARFRDTLFISRLSMRDGVLSLRDGQHNERLLKDIDQLWEPRARP